MPGIKSRRWLGTYSGIFSFTLNVALLAGGWLPFLWNKSIQLGAAAGFDPSNEIVVTIIFFLLDSAKGMIIGMPWDLYSTFVVEERHGFNKQTLSLYFVDQLKQVRSHYKIKLLMGLYPLLCGQNCPHRGTLSSAQNPTSCVEQTLRPAQNPAAPACRCCLLRVPATAAVV